MDNCCLCGVVTTESDEIYVECNETKRMLYASVCDSCLEMSQANPFYLATYFQAQLDRFDKLTTPAGLPAMAN